MPLKRLASLRVSNVDKKTVDGELPVRLCNYTDVYHGDTIRPDQEFMVATASRDQVANFRLQARDVIITKDSETADDIGIPAYVAAGALDLICGYHLALIRPNALAVDGRFLFWAMASAAVRHQLAKSATGITRFGLRTDKIGDVRLLLPSVPLQLGISEFLDEATARIDHLVSKKLSLVELICQRSENRQIEIACGRRGPRTMRDSEQGWLGAIPSHWPVERLKYVARLESGHTPSRSRPELWIDCTTPWLTLNDLSYLEQHEFIDHTINRISKQGLDASSARVLPAGTVVLSRDATVGRCGILARPMATSQHFVDWICSEVLLPRYLWLLFRTVMQSHFDSVTSGATLRTIGMPDVKQLVVPVPPLDEQHEIVAEAEEARTSAHRGIGLLQRQIELLQERRQALITAAVTGQLDIPGAA